MRKLTSREKLLLKGLLAALLACGLMLFLAMKAPELKEVGTKINSLTENIKRVKALEVNETELGKYYDKLKIDIQKEKESFYTEDERDLTRLGIRLLALLKKHGLSYSRLNKVDSADGNYLEISLGGTIVRLLNFLEEIYAYPKYLSVNYLTINNKNGQVKVTIRMNYGELAEVSH
jgi:hypothetical protein